jgi:hypothetical protein
LPLIVPLVLYHGAQPWQHEREFAGLFTDAAPEWRWVPRCSSMRCGVTYRVAGET